MARTCSFETESATTSITHAETAETAEGRLMAPILLKDIKMENISFAATSFTEPPREVSTVQEVKGLSFSDTVANFVVYLIGGCILVLPSVMRDVGFLTAPCLMVAAFATTCECAILTDRCCRMADSVSDDTDSKVNSYEALAGEALGPIGKTLLAITKNGYLLGLLVFYSLLVTDGISGWFPTADKGLVRWFVTFPMMATLAMIKDLAQIKRFSSVGFCAAGFQCLLLGIAAGGHLYDSDFVWPKYDLIRGGATAIGAAMATCFASCGSLVCAIPAVRGQMKNSEELPLAVRTSLVIVLLIYLNVMAIFYFAFGRGISGNAMMNITDPGIASFIRVVLLVNLLISIPSIAFYVISVFESSGSRRICTTMSLQNIIFRAGLVAILVFFGMLLPHVSEVVGLISASFGGFNCLVFPRLCYYGISKRRPAADGTCQLAGVSVIAHIGVFCVTVVAMPFGIIGAIENLIASMK